MRKAWKKVSPTNWLRNLKVNRSLVPTALSLVKAEVNFILTKEKLYFTDSGPVGESSIQEPRGGVYVIDCDPGHITPLAYSCLAHPSGLCLSKSEKFLYVCETANNRLLRFIVAERCNFRFTVFYQFSGRYGPTDVTAHPESGNLYVALFESRSRLA